MDELSNNPLHDGHVRVRDAHLQKIPHEIPFDSIDIMALDQSVNILGRSWAILAGPLENERKTLPVKTIIRDETGRWWLLGRKEVTLEKEGGVDREAKIKAGMLVTEALRALGQTDYHGRTEGLLPIYLVSPKGELAMVDRNLDRFPEGITPNFQL